MRMPNYRHILADNMAQLSQKVDGGLGKNPRRSVLTKGV